MGEQSVLYSTKPSLRRAYFFAIVYLAAVVYGMSIVGYTDEYRSYWHGQIAVLAVCLAYAHLSRATTSYIVTEDEVRMTRGILWRHAGAASHLRITNIAARQSPLERVLFIANLFIDTAGGEVKEIVFRRITKTDAQNITKIVRERLAHMRKSGVANVQSVVAASGP